MYTKESQGVAGTDGHEFIWAIFSPMNGQLTGFKLTEIEADILLSHLNRS